MKTAVAAPESSCGHDLVPLNGIYICVHCDVVLDLYQLLVKEPA